MVSIHVASRAPRPADFYPHQMSDEQLSVIDHRAAAAIAVASVSSSVFRCSSFCRWRQCRYTSGTPKTTARYSQTCSSRRPSTLPLLPLLLLPSAVEAAGQPRVALCWQPRQSATPRTRGCREFHGPDQRRPHPPADPHHLRYSLTNTALCGHQSCSAAADLPISVFTCVWQRL